MSITDMTGHMECMVVSECLWDDCILSTPSTTFSAQQLLTGGKEVVMQPIEKIWVAQEKPRLCEAREL